MNAVVIAAGRAEMNHDQYDNTYITDILKTVKIIALVQKNLITPDEALGHATEIEEVRQMLGQAAPRARAS